MDSFLEYFTSTEETLQEKKQVKVEVAEELKDTCWLEERISESQIQSLKKTIIGISSKEKWKRRRWGYFSQRLNSTWATLACS